MSDNKNSELTDNKAFLETASKSVRQTFDLYTSEKLLSETDKPKVKHEQGESIDSLDPELQTSIAKIQRTVDKEKVESLLNRNKEHTSELFATGNGALTEEQKATVLKKLNKWESTEEINRANASVMASWMSKFGKSK